jgi:GAF domain-containing protein
MKAEQEISRLNERLQRRESEVTVLQRIAMAVASAQDLPEVLQTIVHLTIQVMGCEKAAIFELNEEGKLITIRAWEGLSQFYADAAEGLDASSVRAQAVLGGEPLAVEDVYAYGAEDLVTLASQEGYRAFVDVPMRSRGRNLGLLSAYYADTHEFSTDEIEMFVSFADQAAVAMETARLMRDQKRRITELASLEEVGRAISGTLNLDELLERIYQQTLRLMDTTNFFMTLYYEETQEWEMRIQVEDGRRQPPLARQKVQAGLTGWIIQHREPLLLKHGATDFLYQQGIDRIGRASKSWLGVPMLLGEHVIGVVAVQSYEREGAYDEGHMRVLATIARQAAVSIQNARTVAEMQRLNDDLQRTLDTQAQLVETIHQLSTPVVPLMEGIIFLPLVGHIDSDRARQTVERLLLGVQDHRARLVIVDITGVPVVDTMVAQALVQAAQAVHLLGAEAVLVGIMPEVAQTMVGLGIDLTAVVTRSDLQSGLEYAVSRVQTWEV